VSVVRHMYKPAGLALAMGLAPSDALAQGAGPPYSIDVEFLRPAFGHQGFTGVDAPIANRNLTLRYGTVLQYEQAPLTLYEAIDNVELGAVVTNRFSGLFGVSVDVERVTFSVLLPTAANWGTEQEAFGRDGFGLGDIGASGRIVLVQTPNDIFNIGARVGLILPTGRKEAYMGEGRMRFAFGGLASLRGGPFTVATDLGLHTRTAVETNEDFVASNEIVWGNAARVKLPDASRVGLNAQILSRSVLEEFLQGGAENAVELLGGVEFYPTRQATLGIGAGRGLTEGYGTTDFRILTSLLIEQPQREPGPPQYTMTEPPPPYKAPPPPPMVEDKEEPVFSPGVIAVKVADEIFIKEQIQFVVDTNIIQEYSKPYLQAVAKIINDDAYVGHVVIEGHASQEGDYQHNYTLAESRSRRIWEYFMELGVAKERISYRGMGEVQPVVDPETGQFVLGEDEESLQKNRRVNFLVIKQFQPDETLPTYPETQILPWNAQPVRVVRPAPPAVVAPEPKGPKLDEFGLPIDDDDDLDVGDPKKPEPKKEQ
jgi:outer membrane protein OmpA-like peptidoglycan-associated protein